MAFTNGCKCHCPISTAMEFTLMLIWDKYIKVFGDCGEKLMMLQWNK
jgi:hypothetical protein